MTKSLADTTMDAIVENPEISDADLGRSVRDALADMTDEELGEEVRDLSVTWLR